MNRRMLIRKEVDEVLADIEDPTPCTDGWTSYLFTDWRLYEDSLWDDLYEDEIDMRLHDHDDLYEEFDRDRRERDYAEMFDLLWSDNPA